VAAPYSKSYGRTAIVSVHASAGAGLSLVRHLRSTAALRFAAAVVLRNAARDARCGARAGLRLGRMRRLGKRCASEAG
jgi:hypothetical protein